MITLILTAAGTGSRTGFAENKIFYDLGGETVLEKAYSTFAKTGLIGEYIVTVGEKDAERVSALIPQAKIVIGGDTRAQSVKNGLAVATGEIVLVHDCARPFVDEEIIKDCIASVKRYGSGIAAYPAVDTLADCVDGYIEQNLGKRDKYMIQTPQGFYLNDIKRAYARANGDEPDESALYLKYIGKPHLCKGAAYNRKLTFAEDFRASRVGNGYDIHPLVAGRKLILGGVRIPHEKGLAGHSDADVLVHAVMDALLSAAGLKDIGHYFPDTDSEYENISSMILLERVMKLIGQEGYRVVNATAAVIAQKPRLAPYVNDMIANMANALNIATSHFGLTATTAEGLGFVGHEEGIAVYATALLEK